MIEEILSDIRKAEKEAADKVAAAESRAEEIRVEAEAESARILEKAASDAKNYRASEAARAEKEAAESRDLYDAETLRICAELKKKYADKTDLLADEIFRRIENGDC